MRVVRTSPKTMGVVTSRKLLTLKSPIAKMFCTFKLGQTIRFKGACYKMLNVDCSKRMKFCIQEQHKLTHQFRLLPSMFCLQKFQNKYHCRSDNLDVESSACREELRDFVVLWSSNAKSRLLGENTITFR